MTSEYGQAAVQMECADHPDSPVRWRKTTHADVWTDHAGNAHERCPSKRGVTRCGLNAGRSNTVLLARACSDCVTAHLAEHLEPVCGCR
jgi:hypothetical protein